MAPPILITGATGFIGRRLTADLTAQGAVVRVLARDRARARALFGNTVEIAPGDIRDEAALAEACAGVGTLYHIAGCYRFGLRHARELWATNVEGTENVLRVAAAAGVETIVHLSSAGVLAPSGTEPGRLLDESDFPARASRLCPYKRSKWEAERRVLAWARRGLPVVIASTTCPIGRGDDAPTPTGRLIRDFLGRRFPFYCRTGLNFIGVDDLSQGLQRVAAYGRPGERYLISDENLWLRDFLHLLAAETGLPAPERCLPGVLIKLIGLAGEGIHLLDPKARTARACLETALQADRVQFFSNAKARDELGWQPVTPLRESIREAVDWFRARPASPLPVASAETHVQ
jgi:dihydroflavonol-4-reductase